jgi:hypothetical protein
VVKSDKKETHIQYLQETFKTWERAASS